MTPPRFELSVTAAGEAWLVTDAVPDAEPAWAELGDPLGPIRIVLVDGREVPAGGRLDPAVATALDGVDRLLLCFLGVDRPAVWELALIRRTGAPS